MGDRHPADAVAMSSSAKHYAVMIRTQVQFEEEELSRLKEEAARRNCSISELVRRSVKAELGRAALSRKVEAVMELAGKYNSGQTNLARDHDAALDEGW